MVMAASLPQTSTSSEEPHAWAAGDTWVYGFESNLTRMHTLTIQSCTNGDLVMHATGSLNYSDGSIVLTANMTSITTFDGATLAEKESRVNITHSEAMYNFYANASFSPGLRYLDLPLQVGKRWDLSVHADVETNATFSGSYPFGPGNLTYEFYVEGEVDITVPAGTSRAYAVLMNFSREGAPVIHRYRYYYSDEAKNIVRFEALSASEGQGFPLYPQYLWLGVTYGEINNAALVLHSYSLNTAIAPTPMHPEDGGLTNDDTPEFSWLYDDLEGDEQTAFIVEIDDSPDFASIDYTSGVVSSSARNWTPDEVLDDGLWFWRVRTQDERGLWSNDSVSSLTVDATQPYVLYVAPLEGTRYWNVSGNIHVEFSESMNTTSVEEAFVLTSGGRQIEGAFIWSLEGSHLRFNVTQGFEYGTEYTVVITTDAKDLAGNPLAASHESTFTTKDLARTAGQGLTVVIALAVAAALVVVAVTALKMRRRTEAEEKEPPGSSR